MDAAGVKVTLLSNSHVSVTGVDRWGQPLAYEYDSPEYFGKALPVLERSFTPEQGQALRKIALEIAPHEK